MGFLNDILKTLKRNTLDKTDLDEKAGSFISQNVTRPTVRGLSDIKNFIKSPQSIDLPEVPDFAKRVGEINTPFGNFQPLPFVRDVVNEPFSFAANTASDLVQAGVRLAKQKPYTQYQNLKSPASKFGYNIGALANPRLKEQLGIKNNPQEVIANVAETVMGPLSVYGGGKIFSTGKQALKQSGAKSLRKILKKEAKINAKIGGFYGSMSGLAEGRNDELGDQLVKGARGGVTGIIGGGALGTAIPLAGAGTRRALNSHNKMMREESLEQFARNLPKYLETPKLDPVIAKYKRALQVDKRTAKEIKEAIYQTFSGYLDKGADILDRSTKEFLPQFDNLDPRSKAHIWAYILDRKQNLGKVPPHPLIQDLDNAIFKVAGFDVRQSGTFAGPKAAEWALRKTGKFTNLMDKKPRFEIDDRKSKVDLGEIYTNGFYSASLNKVLKHPELFKQYPELKDIKVKLEPLDLGTNGFYDPKTNSITINELAVESVDPKQLLLHEVQHVIQGIEGFARGASVGMDEKEIIRKFRPMVENLPAFRDLKTEVEKNDFIINFARSQTRSNDLRELAYDAYRKSSGEIESRSVENRMGMTPEQRATTLPYSDQGIPLKDTITRLDDGSVQEDIPQNIREIGGKIKDFITRNFSNRENTKLELFEAQPKTVAFIQEKLGIDVSKFKHTIDSFDVRHATNRHSAFNKGNLQKGEVPLTIEDFENVPLILSNPDNIRLSSKPTKQGNFAIIYQKRIGNEVYYVEEIRNSSRTLALKTMYKQKPSSVSYSLEDPNFVRPSEKTPTSEGNEGIIPQVSKTSQPISNLGNLSRQQLLKVQPRTVRLQERLNPNNLSSSNQVLPEVPSSVSLNDSIPQLPAPMNRIALPGGFVARTPGEAKRLFKKTGQAPELDFSLRNSKKPIEIKGEAQFYNAEPNSAKLKIRSQKAKENQFKTEFDEWQDHLFDTTGARTVKGAIDDVAKLMGEATEAGQRRSFENTSTGKIISNKAGQKLQKGFLERAKNWKDKPKVFYVRERFDRNLEDIAGEDAPMLIERYFKPVQKAEANRQRWLNQERTAIKKLDIKPGSAESRVLQLYGERKMSLDRLKKELPNTWQKVVEAEKIFRTKYDQYLVDINKVLVRNGYDPIPKRKDYFIHFHDLSNVLERFGIPVRDNTIPTDISGLTADFKPGKNFFTSALPREGDLTDFDAVKGMDRYLEGASKQIFHTDNIQNLRLFEKGLRERFAGTTHLSNFVADLGEYINNLAGKKSMLDRSAEGLVGRNVYAGAQRIRKQVGANMVGANISSALTNSIPLTQSLATTSKPAFVKGMLGAVISPLKNDGFAQKSDFLTRRFGSDPLFVRNWDKVANKGAWIFKVVDRFVSETITRAKYHEGLSKGLSPEQALKRADDYASRLIGDRSLGSQPTLFDSKTAGFLTQFQLEVNNQVSVLMKDIPRMNEGNKVAIASALGQVALYSYLYNNLYESFFGRRPAFDPLGVGIQAYEDYTNPDMKEGQATKNTAINIASQLPFTSVLTGGRLPTNAALPDVSALVKGETSVGKELLKPVTYIFPPTGGGQIKKTIEGIGAFAQGGSVSKSGRVRYPIEQTPGNFLRTAIGGQYALPQAREYFREGRTPLGEAQSEAFLNTPIDQKQAFYDTIMQQRADKREDDRINDAIKSNGDVSQTGDIIRWLDEEGSVQTVDLSEKAISTTKKGIDAYDKDSSNSPAAKARKIFSAPEDQVSSEQKEAIYKKFGFTAEDVRYDYISQDKFSNDERTAYIVDKDLSHDELVERILTGRRESISGKMFVRDGVIDNLRDLGLLSYGEAKQLKAIKLDKDGKAKTGSGRKGSNKQLKAILKSKQQDAKELSELFGSLTKSSEGKARRSKAVNLASVLNTKNSNTSSKKRIEDVLRQKRKIAPINSI